MSEKDIQQQHETINTIAKQLATIIKWWPVLAIACSFIVGIGTVAIAGYKYDGNLVKKDEYAKLLRAVDRIGTGRYNDSVTTSHEFIAVNKRIDSLADPKGRKRGANTHEVTETKDENGVITYNPYN